MAEIAVTAAITAVQVAISFLNQPNLRWRLCHDDFKFVGDWLKTMKAYLKDTEGKEGTEGLKDRVQKVRDVAYEIEDIVEDFLLQVPEHFHEHKITEICHHVAHAVSDLMPLRRLSSRIEAIKAKIKDIKDLDPFRVPAPEFVSSSGSGEVNPEVYPILKEDELVGIDRRSRELLDHMRGTEQQRLVISVVGSRGAGKTTLMKEVYQNVKEGFECSAWIPIPNPCRDIPERISAAMQLPVSQGTETGQKLRSFLRPKRYIIFLDGIWSKEEWNCINEFLPNSGNGSRVIISTHKRDIASYCAEFSHHIYDLRSLTWKEGWELFCRKAFRQAECPKHLVEWSENILKRCEGLPLPIVAVGILLSSKSQNPSEFKKLHDSLGYELGSNADLSIMGRILLQSYYHLSYNLRCCFLYFCNFPEDYSVTSGRLIRMWIAERFVEEKSGRPLEQVAEEYLNELIQMGLVQVSRRNFEGKVRSCRVHNLVREFILSKSEKDNFCSVFTRSSPSSDEKPRRLSLHGSCTDLFEGKAFSHVRTLSMFRIDSFSETTAGKLVKSFRLLRVLDLEDADLKSFPEEITTLMLLRYLSLRNTKVKEIPKSIKKLQNLVTLDLRQTFISKLPKKILKLHKLLYLLVDLQDANRGSAGVEVVPGIGRLKLLQKLSLIKASCKKNCRIVKELGCLTELRKLGVSELKEEDGKDLCASIEKMEHLSSLHVTSTGEEAFLDLDYMNALPCLIRRVHLTGRLKNIPRWIGLHHSLAKICLKWSKLDSSPLVALQALPSLAELQLVDAYNGEELEFKAGWFKELRMLEIEKFSRLHTIVVRVGAMPQLRKLIFRSCKSLNFALGIDRLTKLEETLLLDMPPFQNLR